MQPQKGVRLALSWRVTSVFFAVLLLLILAYLYILWNQPIGDQPWAALSINPITGGEAFRYEDGRLGYVIIINYYCSGNIPVIVNDILVDKISLKDFWSSALVNGISLGQLTIPEGERGELVITFPDSEGKSAFKPGQIIAIRIRITWGSDFATTAVSIPSSSG